MSTLIPIPNWETIAGRDVFAAQGRESGRYFIFDWDSMRKEWITWSPESGHETAEDALAWARENIKPGSLAGPVPRAVPAEFRTKDKR